MRRIQDELIAVARSLFRRGYSFGTAGNLSARDGDRVYVTPTNSSFETVDELAALDLAGNLLAGPPPSKETPFHLAIYAARADVLAVVHLHSRYATALSCLRDLNVGDALTPLTPYYAMRVPKLPVLPYYPPGDAGLGPAIAELATESPAILMRNHGLVAIGASIRDAAALAEEVEEQARLFFLLGERGRPLAPREIGELRRRFR